MPDLRELGALAALKWIGVLLVAGFASLILLALVLSMFGVIGDA